MTAAVARPRPRCRHCGTRPQAPDSPRGLCWTCRGKQHLLVAYPSESPLPACRHCNGPRPVNRPRGLCWTCYYTPGVRDLYAAGSANPATAKYVRHDLHPAAAEPTLEELDRVEAEQRPTMPADHFDVEPPGEYVEEPEPDRRCGVSRFWAQWATPPADWLLTPETEPDRIAADQRVAVREAVKTLGRRATVEAVSEAVVLSAFVVTRRLAELGLEL